jgi:predicted Rossmann fold nucleotide-binding protein DprA/Smf involved in DNA uptake
MEYLGNKEILKCYKIGFLCSRKVPSAIILKTYDWAIAQRDAGNCIISGFHSKIEKDVLHYLLKGTQPVIMVLARGHYTKIPPLLKKEVDNGRLLIISQFSSNVKRASEREAFKRNETIVEISDELFVPFAIPGGQLEKLLETGHLKNKKITQLTSI